MRRTWVRIDFTRLAMRLWQSQGRWLNELEIRQWLEDGGYSYATGMWYAFAGGQHRLEPDEIIELVNHETHEHVMFVERQIGGPFHRS